MKNLRPALDFYVQSSLHVALSVLALVQVTRLRLGLPLDIYVSGFAFFGTVVGYNFIKYDALARSGAVTRHLRIKLFVLTSAICAAAALFCFWNLSGAARWTSLSALLITVLYALPFFPNRKNARDWAGLKIYFVAFSWAVVTVVLPVLNSGAGFSADFWIICVQRFLLIVVLLLIFEIIDLATDDVHLHTVPQQIGVNRTKILGITGMVFILLLDVFKHHSHPEFTFINVAFGLTVCAFLAFATPYRPKYYTVFWAESLPVFWWLALELRFLE